MARGVCSHSRQSLPLDSGVVAVRHHVSVFAPVRYMVVKTAHFSSEVVLQTTKHMVIYPGLGSSLEVITLHPVV
jgi:hypothetical protein